MFKKLCIKILSECEEYKDKYKIYAFDAITNGSPVLNAMDCPHMSRLGWRNNSHTKFHCGGSLISEDFVITAAHCKVNGEVKTTNVVRLYEQDDYDVRNFIIHEQYDQFTKHNDIALVRLKNRVRLDFYHTL
jgi:secreted trypsin-like serine protease